MIDFKLQYSTLHSIATGNECQSLVFALRVLAGSFQLYSLAEMSLGRPQLVQPVSSLTNI